MWKDSCVQFFYLHERLLCCKNIYVPLTKYKKYFFGDLTTYKPEVTNLIPTIANTSEGGTELITSVNGRDIQKPAWPQ